MSSLCLSYACAALTASHLSVESQDKSWLVKSFSWKAMAIKMLLENSYEEQTVKDLSSLATIVLLLLCDVSYLEIGF